MTFLFCCLLPLGLEAAPVGTIRFLDGEVTMVRNGQVLGSNLVQEGAKVENQDTFRTGAGASVEVELDGKTGIRGTFRVGPRSSACLTLSELKAEQTGVLELLAGTVSVKVNKMLGKTGLQVKTELAQLGVRGTQFQVFTTPNGDLLVLTLEGRVACSDGMNHLDAVEGRAVESLRNEPALQTVPYSTEPQAFADLWQNERLEVLRTNAAQAFQFYSQRYTEGFDDVRSAHERLVAEAGWVISLWESQGEVALGDLGSQIREKNAIVGPLFDVKGAYSFVERYRFHLDDLRPYLPADLDVGAFYRKLDHQRAQLDQWVFQYRYLVKLYSLRNDGEFPLEEFDPL